MTILTEKHKKWPIYNQLRKCGELTASSNLDCFGLNCIFCSTIFTRLEEFNKHIKKEHAIAVDMLYAEHKNEDKYQDEEENEYDLKPFSALEVTLNVEKCESVVDEVEIKLEPNLTEPINETHNSADPFEEVLAGPSAVALVDRASKRVPIKIESRIGFDDDTETESDSDSEYDPEGKNAESEDNDYELQEHRINLLALDKREILSYLIDFYEKNPMVWDSTHKDYLKQNKKLENINGLSVDIETKFEVMLSAKIIRKTFANLQTLYSRELRGDGKVLQNHDDVAKSTKLWCFDKLKFLYQKLKNKKKKTVKPFLQMSNEQLLELVSIYQKYPMIWHMDNYGKHKKEARNEAAEQMLKQTCSQMELDITLNNMQAQITRFKNYYIADKRTRLQCELEDKVDEFKPKQQAFYDKLRYLDDHIEPFRCEQCNEIFNSYTQFRTHLAAHEGRRPFPCKLCDKDYHCYSNLEIHIRRTHTGEMPFKCTVCERAFISASELNVHQHTHSDSKPYICHQCGVGFPSSSFLTRHQRRQHRENYRLQCPHCPKKFCENYRFKAHINSHLQLREHVCGVCGKGFFAKKTLQQHEDVHSDVLKYPCDICGKAFKQLPSMYLHRKTHLKRMNLESSVF